MNHLVMNGRRFTCRALASGLTGLILVGLVGACGKFSQDPYEGRKFDDLKPPGTDKPKPRKPTESDYLVIDAPSSIEYTEGVDGGTKSITGRVLYTVKGKKAQAGVDYDIRIENLADFQGATYDQVSGQFNWIPAAGTVGNDEVRKFSMKIVMTTRGTVFTKQELVPVTVSRMSVLGPEIVSVDNPRTEIREEDRGEFSVTVRDREAEDIDGKRPTLITTASQRGASAADLIKVKPSESWNPNPTRSTADKSLWMFRMVVSTIGKEITNSSVDLTYDLLAFSAKNRVSSPRTNSIRVLTSLATPMCSWDSIVEFRGGQPNVYNFQIYDPKSEGRLEYTVRICAESGAECACRPQSGKGRPLACTLKWTPPNPSVDRQFAVQLDLVNQSPIFGDSYNQRGSCSGSIRVLRTNPPEPPTPSPTPRATPLSRRSLR